MAVTGNMKEQDDITSIKAEQDLSRINESEFHVLRDSDD